MAHTDDSPLISSNNQNNMATTNGTSTAPSKRPAAIAGSDNKGITIEDAMSILSTRAEDGGEKRDVANVINGNGGVTDKKAADELKKMGQTIDLVEEMDFAKAGRNGVGCDCATDPAAAADADADSATREALEKDEKHAAMRLERTRRSAEIRSSLEVMTVSDLLGAVLGAQRERVARYRDFDSALGAVLSSGNITNYPAACARATASFSVLSDTVNAVRSVLAEKNNPRKETLQILDRLQKREGEKLNLTAALHLERIRAKDASDTTGGDGNGGGNNHVGAAVGGGSEKGEVRLLREGVRSLEGKVVATIEDINDILEELRYAVAEEDE